VIAQALYPNDKKLAN